MSVYSKLNSGRLGKVLDQAYKPNTHLKICMHAPFVNCIFFMMRNLFRVLLNAGISQPLRLVLIYWMDTDDPSDEWQLQLLYSLLIYF